MSTSALDTLRPHGFKKAYGKLPPLLCGLSLVTGTPAEVELVIKAATPAGVKKWTNARKKATDKAKGSFPLFLEEFLKDAYVQERAVLEFKAEATIQDRLMNLENKNDSVLQLTGTQKKKPTTMTISQQPFFSSNTSSQTPDLRFGSWSLSSEYIYFATQHSITMKKNTTSVFGSLGPYFESWAESVVNEGKKKKKKNSLSESTLEAHVNSMIRAAKSLQTVMYDGVDLGHAMVRLHPNVDKNFISNLKLKYLSKNTLVVSLLNLYLGDDKEYITKDNRTITSSASLVQYYYGVNKFRELEQLKSLNVQTATKKATLAILNPIIVKEATFREVVTSMLRTVFDFSGKTKWDAVRFTDDIKKDTVSDRLSTAIMLLQLCIGSRVSGIMFANKITKLDVLTKQKETGEKGSEETRSLLLKSVGNENALVRVENLTKERKDFEAKISKVMDTSQFAKIEMSYDSAKEIVDREKADHFIDKPFQYYLLDPAKYVSLQHKSPKDELKPSDFYTSKDPTRQNPREVFLQLLRQVRLAIKAFSSNRGMKLPWVQYNMDGGDQQETKKDRMIDYVDYNALDKVTGPQFLQLHQIFYIRVNEECKTFLSKMKSLKGMTTTHTLRRLYTCYSFEYFGRGRLKEVGYAQYVLRHKSIETSIRYTVIQFDMTINTVALDKALLSEKITLEINEVKDDLLKEINDLKRKLGEVESAPLVKKQKTDPTFVRFMNRDGQEAMVERKPRSVRGMTEEAKIAAGVEVAERLEAKRVNVTRVNLVKLGVANNSIVESVLKAYSKSKD